MPSTSGTIVAALALCGVMLATPARAQITSEAECRKSESGIKGCWYTWSALKNECKLDCELLKLPPGKGTGGSSGGVSGGGTTGGSGGISGHAIDRAATAAAKKEAPSKGSDGEMKASGKVKEAVKEPKK